MEKPANPAIIIGLGGTGQWVLTYVKKNLIDTYGRVPPTIKLLAFDTTSDKTEAKLEKGEEHARVGNVQLESDEFVFLGGNIRSIAEEIKKAGKYPCISSWFQASSYLSGYENDAFELSKGAGQRRPFGRMAVFYDLIQSPSIILQKIEQSITTVKANNEKNQPIEIYVVCSLAGGTGSGMFIDIAHIARKFAEQQQGVSFAIRGFLVLQNTFQQVINLNHVLANSFAAMRELDRFLLVFNRDYPIPYTDTQRKPPAVYQSIYKSKLFDNVYLLDGRRPNMPLDGKKPWLGVFPSAAECISALLDPETGDTFSQHYKNVNDQLAKKQKEIGQALYSSLGAYTYILPVEDMLETAVHHAAIELLREYLFKINEDTRTGELQVTTASQREWQQTPQSAVSTFFKSDKTPGDQPNVPFIQNMALALEGGRLDDAQYISNMATLSTSVLTWLMPAERDDAVNQISSTINGIIEASLGIEVITSDVEKDDTHSAAERIERDIKKFREKKLGFEEKDSNRVPGEMQKGLAEYAYRNRWRFRRALSDFISRILNGESSDPIIAKSGKLPYAQKTFESMLKYFDEFKTFMENVNTYRTQSGEIGKARTDAINTRDAMYQCRDRTGLFDRLNKVAIHTQEDYIAAEDYLFALEREEILYQALMDYTIMLRSIVEDAKASLDIWVQNLTLGGVVDSGEVGTYRILLEQQAQIKRRRDEQEQIEVYEYITNEDFEDEMYRILIGDKWNDILRRFRWHINLIHTDKELTQRVQYGKIPYRYDWEKQKMADFSIQLMYTEDPLPSAKYRDDPASLLCARFLIDHLRPYFADIRNESIAERLSNKKRADGLAKEMLDNTGALVDFQGYEQPANEKHNFVCVNRGTQVEYFQELAERLRSQAPSDKDNQVIGLTNKQRCIVLSTQDLIIGQNTNAVKVSRAAYMEHTGDHRLLHNFPAEVNASFYEDRIINPPVSEARRLLSPMLVVLLEDRKMVRRYVLARIYGLIREEPAVDVPGHSQFILTLDRQNRRDLASRIRLTKPSTESGKELDAMTEFIFVKIDQVTGARFIKDITPSVNIQVSPERVDEAIDLRQKAITTGREQVVDAFEMILQDNITLLDEKEAQARAILVSAFRRFMMREYDSYNREMRTNSKDEMKKSIVRFMDDNRDCLARSENADKEAQLYDQFAQLLSDLLTKADTIIKPPATSGVLVRKLEDYINRELIPKRRGADQLEHDLASVMHLIVWDEIERIERMEA